MIEVTKLNGLKTLVNPDLIETVESNPDTVIGVRTPKLRAFAKALSKEETIGEFLECLPHQYYEENNIHGFIIEQIMKRHLEI